MCALLVSFIADKNISSQKDARNLKPASNLLDQMNLQSCFLNYNAGP